MGWNRAGSYHPVRTYLKTGVTGHRYSDCCTLGNHSRTERLIVMAKLQNILFRIAALFGSSALAAIAGGALIGVELWKSAALAGLMACAQVIEKLLRFSVDGSLSKEEIELAFAGAGSVKKKAEEVTE